MTNISENVDRVRENILLAKQRAGRISEDICLCAVTKYVSADRITEAVACGIDTVGENHAQELIQKLTFYKQNALHAHFIGQLQTNKVKYVCGNAEMIQSCDRMPLLETIDSFCAKAGTVQAVLIQINIGHEPQKGGVIPEHFDQILEAACKYPHILVRGIMCVPPALDKESVRPFFRQMRKLYDKKISDGYSFDTLSMGMSQDYMTAIEEGSTMIRVGSAIFGPRQIPGGIIHG